MSNQDINMNKLTGRNLVTIGIFAALYLVLTFIGGVVFAINPIFTFLTPLGCAILSGPVFLLMSLKVPKAGAISICGIIVGIIMFATGMYWGMALAYIILGVIADFIASIGKYKNPKITSISYITISLSGITSYAVFFLNKGKWLQYMLKQGADPVYYEVMMNSAKFWYLPAIVIGTIISAAISSWIGRKLLKKQFEKAGIV